MSGFWTQTSGPASCLEKSGIVLTSSGQRSSISGLLNGRWHLCDDGLLGVSDRVTGQDLAVGAYLGASLNSRVGAASLGHGFRVRAQ